MSISVFIVGWLWVGLIATVLATSRFRSKGLTDKEKPLLIVGVLLGPITFILFIIDLMKS